MRADLAVGVIEIVSVLLRGSAGISDIVDNDVVYLFKLHAAARGSVNINELNIHPIRHRFIAHGVFSLEQAYLHCRRSNYGKND